MTETFGAKSTADEVLSGVELKGKQFLITPASSGIGLESARSLISHGASVVDAVAPIDDTPNPFADGVRSYALDLNRAKQLWEKARN